jgi:hypothetical protein
MAKPLAAYLRVSTREQGRSGLTSSTPFAAHWLSKQLALVVVRLIFVALHAILMFEEAGSSHNAGLGHPSRLAKAERPKVG